MASSYLPPLPPTRVILVRHGRSTYNDQGRYQGSSDEAVLTAKGRASAQQVGRYLRSFTLDAVYSSPLRRVQQTAQELLLSRGGEHLSIHHDPDLREIEMGCWQGLTYQQVKQQYADDYRRWQESPQAFALRPESTEIHSGQSVSNATYTAVATRPVYPVQALYQRARNFWQRLLSEQTGKTILVVSHGGTNQALINTALGFGASAHHGLQQSNCGVSILEFVCGAFTSARSTAPTGTLPDAQLLLLNQTCPLGETLPKLKAGKQGLRLLLLADETLCDRSCHAISERLQSIPIAFCLTASRSQDYAQALLQQHPGVAHLTTGTTDFLQDWQRALSQSVRQRNELMTGIAIASTASIQQLLWQVMGRQSSEFDSPKAAAQSATASARALPLQPSKFQVIHYPFQHHPVVQAINF